MRSSGTSFRPFPLCVCECIELQSCCVVGEHFSEMSLYLLQLSFSPLLIVFEIILQQDMQAELFLSNYLIFHNLDIITPLLMDIWVVSSLGLFEPRDMVVGSRGFGLTETWN